MIFLASQAKDPWEPWDHPGKGKGNPHDIPVVPEPALYGLMMASACSVLLVWRRWRARK